MPLDGGHQWSRDSTVPADDIVAALRRSFDLRQPHPAWVGAGAVVAGRRRTGDGGDHRLGAVRRSSPCDRTRLTADGQVRNCLFVERGERPARLLRSEALTLMRTLSLYVDV